LVCIDGAGTSSIEQNLIAPDNEQMVVLDESMVKVTVRSEDAVALTGSVLPASRQVGGMSVYVMV
jgi:hypothetical protein